LVIGITACLCASGLWVFKINRKNGANLKKWGTLDSMAGAHHIVFANEKGGTGKSTTAVHVAIALASRGARVACIDLDTRQRTLYRYLENRAATIKRRGITLPQPVFEVFENDSLARLETQVSRLAAHSDYLIFDTPGRDDKYARFVATRANTLVTPINDSFVDFDLIGQVDPENFKVRKLSFYAELIFEARMARAKSDGVTIDWVVVRNRLHNMEARNQQRMTDAIAELSKRVGFRSVPGLNERVIYRELFPSGLTLIDKGHLGTLATAHIVARQELRELVTGLGLPELNPAPQASPVLV
jgi:chromosome partitioning protein